MFWMEFFLAFVATLLTALFIHNKLKYRNFPKGRINITFVYKQTLNIFDLTGPIGLPIIGYLPFLGPAPHRRYSELAKSYGNVFSVMFGQIP